MADDLTPWIRLTRGGASARRLNLLLDAFGSPEAVLAASPRELAASARFSAGAAERFLTAAGRPCDDDLRRLEALQVRVVRRADPDYPPLLPEIYDPPPVLYVRGALPDPARPVVGVVGSRDATEYGRAAAEALARELAAAGVTVASGLAHGIDTAAHRGALAGGGATVAVFANGVDLVYPSSNRRLAEEIRERGALISEYPLGTQPDRYNFPRRNRIISGLSRGVLIVEARARSGALITAACAAEQNRDVYAVPGRVDSELSRGPHALLRDGAKLVESAEDILEEIGLAAAPAAPAPPPPDLTAAERQLLALLDREPKALDDVILESGLSASQVNATLLMLEVKGVARRQAGNTFTRAG